MIPTTNHKKSCVHLNFVQTGDFQFNFFYLEDRNYLGTKSPFGVRCTEYTEEEKKIYIYILCKPPGSNNLHTIGNGNHLGIKFMLALKLLFGELVERH